MEKLSSNNKRVKLLRKYYESSKARAKDDIYLVEGRKMVNEADVAFIREIFISEDYYENHAMEFKPGTDIPIFILDTNEFNRIVRTNTPQGVVAVLKRRHFSKEYFFNHEICKHILLCERLQDPGNMGTIIRTAVASGFDALILDHVCVDVYNPKCVSASMSGIYKLPILYVSSIPDTIHELNERGYLSIASVMNARYRYDEYPYPDCLAIVIGNEGSGLSKESIETAKAKVRIPMVSKMESLNAAVAAALMMYEVRKKYL